MKNFPVAITLIVGVLLGIVWLGASTAVDLGRNYTSILEAQASIEQARAIQEAAVAVQIASAGQTRVSTINSLLLGGINAAIIGFAVVYVYLRWYRPPQPGSPPPVQPPRRRSMLR